MLDSTTKRRIDTARDILVGKIPDPKSQVEQITIALIYKFMDDMDAEAEELGGSRKFFADGFSNYGWAMLMHSGLGGHEMLNLYAEAISRMPENPGIPPLFRSIFKNAYLPYRDPETLRSFLKIIDEFCYDHSERLGDAFEYLLSVLGSQGDAGQFRTPRHIIDFIVEILAPQKSETVLDPACGTAGFLISSYKHILKNNLDEKGYSTLTPDEKGRMVENFKGYDISPDMVRLSLVNLYLHGFSDPHIYEYDTLTSQERWNEYADVILANPPFMSPKGGIRPHNRFSVQSKRSEVLFVDYIADHLKPAGRAGVIVPEGIIFQSQNAYKQLRKKLVEESLVAVISLPAGVFQPYSGVKTSILIMDKGLSQKADTIAFFKVENDGFGLGAQRRPIDKNDLPQVLDEVKKYLGYIRTGDRSEEFLTNHGLVVKREKVAQNGEYNLSGERYRDKILYGNEFPLVDLGKVAQVLHGYAFKSSEMFAQPKSKNDRPVIKIGNINRNGTIDLSKIQYHLYSNNLSNCVLKKGDIVIALTGATVGKVAEITHDGLLLNQRVGLIRSSDAIMQKFILLLLKHSRFYGYCQSNAGGGAQGNIAPKDVMRFQIPLPPSEIQKEIVAEIELYQKIIDGARAVVENYRPHIPINPIWPMVGVSKVAQINPKTIKAMNLNKDSLVSFVPMADLSQGKMYFEAKDNKRIYELNNSYTYFEDNDVLIAKVTPCFENGKAGLARNLLNGVGFGSSEFAVLRVGDQLLPEWLYIFITSPHFKGIAIPQMTGTGGLQRVPRSVFENYLIPMPPIDTQKEIIEAIEAEQTMVNSNNELIERFEKKIEATINRIWGES